MSDIPAKSSEIMKAETTEATNGYYICVPEDLLELINCIEKYFKRTKKTESLDLICDIYEGAKRIGLDYWSTWEKIIDSPLIYNHRLQFIEDTISFIITQKRDMSIENWNRLMDSSDIRLNKNKQTYTYVHPIPSIFKSINILDCWIKTENGITDMALSLSIMLKIVNFQDLLS